MGLRATKRLFIEDEWERTLKLVEKHRKLDCPNYSLCLEVAVLLGWKGFSCLKCRGEGPDEILLGEAAKQIDRWLAKEIDPFLYSYAPILYKEYFVPL